MKRLLLVSYAFPPQRNPESLLVLATVRALVNSGWAITVLTVDPAQTSEAFDEELLAQVPHSVSIIRTSSLERALLRTPRLRRAFWYVLRLLGLPEQQCGWYFSALKAARILLRERGFDVMHSWASYHTSNVVALKIHREFRLPWVAHFSDPWVDNPYFSFRAPLMQRLACTQLERRIMEEVDAVVFTTEECVRLTMGKYPRALADKACVVPHGYDPDTLSGVSMSACVSSGGKRRPLLLVHTGSFYPGLREPVSLLQALVRIGNLQQLADRLRVRLIGANSELYHPMVRELDLEGVVELIPPVSRKESLEEAARADVLLVIDAPTEEVSVFLPSKLVDYMMLKKPILGITPKNGATARVMSELGFAIVVPDNIGAIAEAIGLLLSNREEGLLKMPPEFDCVASDYHITETTRKLQLALNAVVASRPHRSDLH